LASNNQLTEQGGKLQMDEEAAKKPQIFFARREKNVAD